MDQITNILLNHGLSPEEIAQITNTISELINSCQADAIGKVVDKVYDHAMSFWLLTNSLK
jgi:hypothetical protein